MAVVYVDVIPPVKPTAKASTTAVTNKNVTVTATFSSDSKVKQYSLDNKNWKTYTGAVVMAKNGTVYFRAADAAGNYSQVTGYTVKNIDKTAPAKPTAKASTTATTDKSVTITANFSSDSKVKQYSLDNKNWKTYTGAVAMAKNGTVYFRAADAAGNYSQVTSYTVKNIIKAEPDKVAPKAGKVTATQKAQDSVLLTFNGFSDNKGIARYDILLNGKKIGSTTAKSFTYNGKNLAGNLQFVVRAYDAAGNAAKDAKAKVKIQAMAPQAKTLAFSGPEVAEAEYLAMPETPAATEYTAPQELSLADFSLPEPSLLTGSEALCADSCAASLDTTTENILDNKNKGMLA